MFLAKAIPLAVLAALLAFALAAVAVYAFALIVAAAALLLAGRFVQPRRFRPVSYLASLRDGRQWAK